MSGIEGAECEDYDEREAGVALRLQDPRIGVVVSKGRSSTVDETFSGSFLGL
jgi:hypothetical protein